MKFSTFQKKRVVMATIGSLGDLHPYIALALEMKKPYIEPVIAPPRFSASESNHSISSFSRFARTCQNKVRLSIKSGSTALSRSESRR
jgi:hypothetical protein